MNLFAPMSGKKQLLWSLVVIKGKFPVHRHKLQIPLNFSQVVRQTLLLFISSKANLSFLKALLQWW